MRRALNALTDGPFDLLVLGGGITGAGVALDQNLRTTAFSDRPPPGTHPPDHLLLASVVAPYQQRRDLDDGVLAAVPNCSPDVLTGLHLCGRPGPSGRYFS